MGKSRTSAKYLKGARQRRSAGANLALMSLFHGKPNGYEGVIRTLDGRLIHTESIPDPVSRRRAEVLSTKEAWTGDFFQGVSEYCYLKVVGKFYQEGLRRYFSGEKSFFIELKAGYVRRSIVYSSKDIAMMSFNTGRITWVEYYAEPSSKVHVSPPVRSG